MFVMRMDARLRVLHLQKGTTEPFRCLALPMWVLWDWVELSVSQLPLLLLFARKEMQWNDAFQSEGTASGHLQRRIGGSALWQKQSS